MNDLFKLMSLRKPMQLKSMYPTSEAVEAAKLEYCRQWAGIKPSLVARGIENLRNRYPLNWLPDPVEFAREYCRMQPEEHGLPTAHAAWMEACEHCHDPVGWRWSHEAVQRAGRAIGWNVLRGFSNEKRVRDDFEKAYQKLVDRVLSGESLDGGKHIALEDQNSLSVTESSNRYNERRLHDTMRDQGINPEGGRAEFLMRMRGMLS